MARYYTAGELCYDLFALSKAKWAFVIDMGSWFNSVWSWGDCGIQYQYLVVAGSKV